MIKRFARIFCLLGLGGLLLAPVGNAKRFNILVNATASDEYVERAEAMDYQTFHFIKGKFWGGSTRDKGLEQAQFEDLAESLSVHLKKRKMYPEPDQTRGDLLIMISWGRTSLGPNYRELQGITGSGDAMSQGSPEGPSEGGELSSASSEQMLNEGVGSLRSRNRVLLGLHGDLIEPTMFGGSPDQHLWDALDEERYFVILNAFDYQHLKESKELKQLWCVRYNTRAIGIGFEKAYASMTEAVAGVIGLNSNDVVVVKGDTEGKVSLGELEVIEMSEEEQRIVGE
ncbi:hypothetical protein [Pelagicoccus mobilis]|uniref:Uncharacterized protein n=1 Tax=Pelagicoccus mobilis TaxID=415221 RepID=A0A934RU28_9BACT|nr:hypothetical protein [Pelagicoccus mobilis]MBK1876416.1 hypothetical protein [Pelagicoccus mobilis]